MKSLTVLFIALVSLNAFSAEVGEDKASECKFADQGKREAKEVNQEDKKEVKEAPAKGKSV
jgi:hypothetical protein